MNRALKLYYKLTGPIPRKLPSTPEELIKFKKIMVEGYGVPDNEKCLLTLYGHVQKFVSSHHSYRHLAIVAKHLNVATLMQEERSRIIVQLEQKLKEGFEKAIQEEAAVAVPLTVVAENCEKETKPE